MSLVTPTAIRTLQRKLYVAAKAQPDRRFHQLYDKVCREDILAHAYRLARQRGGAPGVDGESFEAIEAQGEGEWLARLGEELRSQRYQPQAGPIGTLVCAAKRRRGPVSEGLTRTIIGSVR